MLLGQVTQTGGKLARGGPDFPIGLSTGGVVSTFGDGAVPVLFGDLTLTGISCHLPGSGGAVGFGNGRIRVLISQHVLTGYERVEESAPIVAR